MCTLHSNCNGNTSESVHVNRCNRWFEWRSRADQALLFLFMPDFFVFSVVTDRAPSKRKKKNKTKKPKSAQGYHLIPTALFPFAEGAVNWTRGLATQCAALWTIVLMFIHLQKGQTWTNLKSPKGVRSQRISGGAGGIGWFCGRGPPSVSRPPRLQFWEP